MNTYVFNLISIFVYVLFFSALKKVNSVYSKEKNANNILLIIIGIQLFFISAFRGKDVGIDLQRYIPRYNIILNTAWKDIFNLRDIVDFEYGYILYNKIIGTLFKGEQTLLIITSAIVILSFSYFIWKYSKIPWLSFYLFITLGFFAGSFNILRQYISMSILLFSIQYIERRNLFKFLVGIIFASLFHTTAICYLILYPLYKFKVNRIDTILLSLLAIVIGFTSKYIIRIILTYTSYSKYFNDIGEGLGNGSGEGNLIVLIMVIACVLFFRKSVETVDINANLWINMLIIAIFFNIFALNLGVFERIMRYFMVSMIIIIPNTVYSIRKIGLRLIGKAIVIILTFYYYFGILMSNYSTSGGTVPFIFMWQ